MDNQLINCKSCPRECGANRKEGQRGICNANGIAVSLMTSHKYEEPCISAEKGSGAIFFSGCALRCAFCQNKKISRGDTCGETTQGETSKGGMSRGEKAPTLSEDEFIFRAVSLAETSDNLNFVTPSHLYPYLMSALKEIKKRVKVPLIFNTSGYDSVSEIEKLKGIADVFLPDFKYSDNALAKRISGVDDYVEKAILAIKAMKRVAGETVMNGTKIARGVIVRHLVLPGYRNNSLEAVRIIAREFGKVTISLMSQYCPDFYDGDDKNLKRRVTSFEYNSVVDCAVALGLDGYMQEREASKAEYCPFC